MFIVKPMELKFPPFYLKVIVSGTESEWTDVLSVIPQSSVSITTFVCLIFINYLLRNCILSLFADDR